MWPLLAVAFAVVVVSVFLHFSLRASLFIFQISMALASTMAWLGLLSVSGLVSLFPSLSACVSMSLPLSVCAVCVRVLVSSTIELIDVWCTQPQRHAANHNAADAAADAAALPPYSSPSSTSSSLPLLVLSTCCLLSLRISVAYFSECRRQRNSLWSSLPLVAFTLCVCVCLNICWAYLWRTSASIANSAQRAFAPFATRIRIHELHRSECGNLTAHKFTEPQTHSHIIHQQGVYVWNKCAKTFWFTPRLCVLIIFK